MIKQIAFGLITAGLISTLGAQTNYSGNGLTGFGGAIGTGSLTLSDNGTTLTGTITRGSGPFNDSLVIYFDTQTGGLTSLPTSGEIGSPDAGRRSIVNEFGSGITSFPSGFDADYALTLMPTTTTDVLFSIPSGANANTLNFVAGASLTNNGSSNATTYTFTIDLANIGITPNSGATFDFVTTYVQPFGGEGGDATFRSNEAFGNSTPTNTGFDNTGFTGFNTYVTAVPEPSSLSLLAGPAILGAWFFVRRRRA